MKYAKKIWLVLNLVCITVIPVFFLLSKNFLVESANKHVMGICYSDFSDEYQRVLNDSIYPTVNERGDILYYRDAKMNQSRQNDQITELINKGCELIILIPVNENVEDGIKYAKEQGVYIVTVDRMLRDETEANLRVFSDSYSSGRDLAKYLVVNRSAGNVLLICKKDEESVNVGAAGFEDYISKLKNNNFKIEGTVYTDGTKGSLKEQLKKIKIEDIDTVFCVSDDLAKWVEQELGNVYILSIGGSPCGKQMVADKKIAATVNQFPSTMGDEAVTGAYNILDGNYEDRTFIVPSKIITINTVDSHNMDKWE